MRFQASTRGKAFLAALLALGLLVAVAGCGSSSSSSSGGGGGGGGGTSAAGGDSGLPDSIDIGWLNSMTGVAGFCGRDELKGAELAIEAAEASGELGGASVHLDEFDDASTPATGVIGFHKLASEGVSAIVGPCLDLVSTGVTPLAQQEEIPMMLTTSNATDVSDSYIFRAGVRQVTYGANVIKYLAEQGVKKVGLLCENDDRSNSEFCEQVLVPAVKENGMTMVSETGASASTTDFSSQIQHLMKGNPEAIGEIMDGPANLAIVNGLRQAGYEGKIFAGIGADSEYFFHEGGPNVEGVLLGVAYSSATDTPTAKEFTKAYKEKYGQNPADLNAHGYDAMKVVLQAISEANSTEPQAIQKALSEITSFEGAQGKITFDSEGSAEAEGGVAEVKGGELVGLKLE